MSILWRPGLFSAAGTGFQGDSILNDGIHLRWMIDPKMGLPFHKDDFISGQFDVYFQSSKIPSLHHASLETIKNSTNIPVHAESDTPELSKPEFTPKGIFFTRLITEPAVYSSFQLINQINYLHEWRIRQDQQKFYEYIKSTAKALKCKLSLADPRFERAETCAVDIGFIRASGFNPGGDGSQNGGCLGALINGFREKKMAWVRAYDRNGVLIAEDWIGVHAFSIASLSNPSTRNKFKIQMRAPGIYFIVVDLVPGANVVQRSEMKWVFCEEYCNAAVWTSVKQPPIRFEGDSDSYSTTDLRSKYYAPFKKTFDWDDLKEKWINDGLNSSFIETLLSCRSSFKMATASEILKPDGDPSLELLSRSEMPVLSTLLYATTDPAIASLLGLYWYDQFGFEGADIMVKAKLPFFSPKSLETAEERLKDLAVTNDIPYFLPEYMGLFSVPKKLFVELGGLVLKPEITPKPALASPSSFTTQVTSMDMLTTDVIPQTKLMVNSILEIPTPPFSILPYQSTLAFEVHRQLDGKEYKNTIDDESPDTLEGLGILPHVQIPVKTSPTIFKLRDSYSLDIPPAQVSRYKIRGYDMFARPSEWTEGSPAPIPVHWYAPSAPGNLSSTTNIQNNELWVEMYVSVSNANQPLQALQQRLEIAIHAVDSNAEGLPEAITWTGDAEARWLGMDYNAADHYPDPLTTNISCLQLRRVGTDVEWNEDGSGVCDTIYPARQPLTEIFVDPSLPEGALDFRSYRIRIAVATLSSLAAGSYRWISRVRIKGISDDGTVLYSRESCLSFRHEVIAPPIPVIQPNATVIPEATFPDARGNSYFNVFLDDLFPEGIEASKKKVNIYRIDLSRLVPDIREYVSGNLLIAGKHNALLAASRSNRTFYQKLNSDPVRILTDRNNSYAVHVNGDLEAYHIIGITSVNAELQERSWDHAAIILFKTPQKLAKPLLNFISTSIKKTSETLINNIEFRASYKQELDSSLRKPQLQLIRIDRNTGRSKFIGQIEGEWNTTGMYYSFRHQDLTVKSWRRYQYEGTLLSENSGKWVRSELKAQGECVASGLETAIPLNRNFLVSFVPEAAGRTLNFEFLVGDFDYSLSEVLSDGTRKKWQGKIHDMKIDGLPGATISLNDDKTNYILTWHNEELSPAVYNLRIWRNQFGPWTNKISIL